MKLWTLLSVVCFCASIGLEADLEAEVRFERDVQPILKRHCDRCHGATNQEAGLALHSRAGLLGMADSEEVVVEPGKPFESLLLSRITDAEAGDLMPLDGQALSKREVAVIRRWIAEGASVPDDYGTAEHWAYVTPTKPHPPANVSALGDSALGNSAWPTNAIDRFVLQRLSDEGLQPSERAEPATLARRASLVLTGLPASLDQIRSLEATPNIEAYEELVDDLLASPTFGQHWARHWLDLARYADSNGFQADQLRDSWAYRDWVVSALNADMPFDQFAIKQLAGDLLPDATDADRIATGFHRTPTCNVEAGVHPEANRVNQVFDRVNTTGMVFLGATLECAQCHDHKYDPFTQKDYYSLFAYFNNTPLEVKQTSGVTYDFVGPKMDLPLKTEQQVQIENLEKQIASLETKRDALRSDEEFQTWLTATRSAIQDGKIATWVVPRPEFSSSEGESFEVLDDGSVLVGGTVPQKTVYRFEYSQPQESIVGLRLDCLTHKDLPGTGPGRGDSKRTNFVLHELELAIKTNGETRPVALVDPVASFSQSKYDVGQAVDGLPNTGWAIAPQFKKDHWATFRTSMPVDIEDGETLTVTLDQHFGMGRVIGRPKISFLVGPPGTTGLSDEIVALLQSEKPLSGKQTRLVRQFFDDRNPQLAKLNKQLAATQKQLKAIKPPSTLVMVEMDDPRETFVMERGDYLALGEKVEPGTPETLHRLDESYPANRLGFANWLVERDNPLLARVTVNRFWAEIFGRGIVSTAEDFGTQCEPPSHPDLLDWLAVEFQDGGSTARQWSVKQLLKTIVLSSTFRQSSAFRDDLAAIDPENMLLARGPRYRMTAEAIRDNALAVCGLLSTEGVGEPIMPYQPDGLWRAVGRNQPKWRAATDDDRFRRGLYVLWKRGAPYPSFTTFDAPDRAACTVKRPRTNTPLQALVLLNDRAYAEMAVALSQRMLREAPSSDDRAVAAYGFELATGRKPSEHAINILVQLSRAEATRLNDNETLIEDRLAVLPDPYRDSALDQARVAAWFAVANVLLNLDETITVN